jgi:hypothetical protein
VDLKIGGIAAATAFGFSLLIGLISQSTLPFLIVWPLVFAAIFFVLVVLAKFLFSQFLPELLDEGDSGSLSLPGSVVNIMEGDANPDDFSSGAAQEPDDAFAPQFSNAARPDDSEKSIGDISSLSEVVARNKASYKGSLADASAGIDQNMENSYTTLGDSGNISQTAPLFDAFAPGAASEAPTEPLASSEPLARAAAKPVKPAKAARSGSSAWYSSSDDTLPDFDSMAGVFANASSEEEPEKAGSSEPARRSKSANREQSLDGNFSPKEIAEGIRTVLKKEKEE